MFNFVNLYKVILQQERNPERNSYGSKFRFLLNRIFVFILFGTVILLNQVFLLLDEIFFFAYRFTKIISPILIIGVPRTGTTLLFRTMAKDRKNFTSFTLAEIVFAPSIIQKLLFYSLYRVDKVGGSPLKKLMIKIQQKSNDGYEKIHPYHLFEAEEDELLLLHTFSSLVFMYIFPKSSVFDKYIHFDEKVDPKERSRIFRYKENCYKRHLFFWKCISGKEKTFLFKNPIFSPKVESIYTTFPDIRIIYTRRSSEQVIPSMISMNTAIIKKMHVAKVPFPDAQKAKDVMVYWMGRLDQQLLEREDVFVCEFDTLIKNVKLIIEEIYLKFGIEITKEFNQELELAYKEQLEYKSEHQIEKEKINEVLISNKR